MLGVAEVGQAVKDNSLVPIPAASEDVAASQE
jgi:hypothetical protein